MLHVYSYQHIDTRLFFWPLAALQASEEDGDCWTPPPLEFLKWAFRAAGWEGDGVVMYFWLPPFCMEEPDTMGCLVSHVKQSNNGTSWLGCAARLDHLPGLKDGYGGRYCGAFPMRAQGA